MSLTLLLRNLLRSGTTGDKANPDLRTKALPPVDRLIDEGISKHIGSQIPEFVDSEGDGFRLFLEAYYEWLEKKQNAYAKTHTLYDIGDLDTTLNEFITQFNEKYIKNFPPELAINPTTKEKVNSSTLMKNIKDFYRSKGTEKSYKLLFRVLYDSALDFYYPKNDMLRVSDGNWRSPKSIKVTRDNLDSDLRNFENRIIQQFSIGGEVLARATVEKVDLYRQDPYNVCELFLKDIVGKFEPDLKIQCDIEGTLHEERVWSQIIGVDIINGGRGWGLGFEFRMHDPAFDENVETAGKGGIFKVKTVGLNGEIKELELLDSGVNYKPIPIEMDVRFEKSKEKRRSWKRRVEKGEFNSTSYISRQSSKPTESNPAERSRRNGGYRSLGNQLNILTSSGGDIDSPGGAHDDPIYDDYEGDASKGEGFEFNLNFGALVSYYGYYKGNDGKLSSNKFIQDSWYYQDFSYVLKSSESIKKYKSVVKRLIHPAGHEIFGKISLLNDVSTPATHHSMFQAYEIPIIGHYTPYNFNTSENLRRNTSGVDLYPHGFNPSSTGGSTADGETIYGLSGGRLELTNPKKANGTYQGFTTGSFVVGQELHNGMTGAGGTGYVASWYLHRASTTGGSAESGVLFLYGVTGSFPIGSTVSNGVMNGELTRDESTQPIGLGNGSIFVEGGLTAHINDDFPLGTGGTDAAYGGSAAAQGYNYDCWGIYTHPNSRGWNKIPSGISFGRVGLRWFFHMPFGYNFHSNPGVSDWLNAGGSTSGYPYWGSTGAGGEYGTFQGVSTGTPNLGGTSCCSACS